MLLLDHLVSVPPEAWTFVERMGMRTEFKAILEYTQEYYSPVEEIVVEFDPCDPTMETEAVVIHVAVTPGTPFGMEADADWMRILGERYPREFLIHVTPHSYLRPEEPEWRGLHGRT